MYTAYGISQEPDYLTLKRIKNAIPQYNSGHIEKMHELKKLMSSEYPKFRLTGNYIDGSGIPHIINYAKQEVMALRDIAVSQQAKSHIKMPTSS